MRGLQAPGTGHDLACQEIGDLFPILFDHAGVSMGVVLTDGSILIFNRTFCEFLGYAEAELRRLNLFQITFPEDRAMTKAEFRKGSENNGSFQYEKRYLRKDGRIVWGLVSGSWITDAAGIAYGVAVIQDITERKRSEEALRASEARYRRLFESNPHPMWIFDLGTLEFLAVNDAAVAHYGYSRREFLAMTILEIRPPEGVPALLSGLARISKEGFGQEWCCHRRKDGSLIEVEIHAHNLEFNGHNARVVLAHDVTEKRRAEERMRLDAAALMSTRDAVIIVDRTPRILSVNPAFTEITGYDQGEIHGEHPRIISTSRQGRSLFRRILVAVTKSGHWAGEAWGLRKSGETFPGWLTVTTVKNPLGESTHFVGVITDLTKLRASEERLQYLACYDALTDLSNRQMLESVLQQSLERARRERHRLALLVMDLDQFKMINESFGHQAGDRLLIAVAKRLRKRVRGEDTLSRLAGDQFAVVMERLQDNADAEILAGDLQAILEAPFVLPEGLQVYLRSSIGISLYPQDGTSAHDLLRGADAAVNLAKARGGNQFCYCTSDLNAESLRRAELQTELRQALDREEFVLHYQPKVDLRSGRIVGVEALLRWQSPKRGMIPPLHFIPVAEKNGLIVPIGAWVIEEVCRQIGEWRAAGIGDISVAVNVSARQFRSGKLEEVVAAALRRHGVAPGCLTLELTESMVMNDPEEAIDRMAGLRHLGVQLSLDDFGTGYSSLGYLGRFRIDQLKIDRSFITDIVTDPNAATIATAVIALAHRMRLKVVAEGVETEAQLGYLRQSGCDEMQGYYFSKPVPADHLATLLREGKSLPIPKPAPEAATLLIVDDEPKILSALRRALFEEGYRILSAGSAREGLELLAQNSVQVVITDQRMPEMCGTEFLSRVKTMYPHTVRLVLSGYADLPTVTESVNEGALYKFLAKPWDDDHLREQIRDAFIYYETSTKPHRRYPDGF